MLILILHAAPTKVKLASMALHVRTATVFFDPYFAFRTFSDISSQEKALKICFIFTSTLSFSMPWFLALETSLGSALIALNFYIIAFSGNSVIAYA